MATILKVNIVVVMATLLLACGGGGSSSDTGGGGSDGSPASSDATLSDLSISPGSLDQTFQSNQASYTTTLGYPVASVQVTPITGDDGASLTVNGVATKSGAPSTPVALPEGENTLITVKVTAADGTTTQSYSIDVAREQAASFAQQAYIKASNAGTDDSFGYSVALDGDTLAVGAPMEGGDASSTTVNPNDDALEAGGVYVFNRSGGVWNEQAYIKASNANSGDWFGSSVALDGDTLAVGALHEDGDANSTAASPNDNAQRAGAAYVYTRSAGGWSQQAYIKASNAESYGYFSISIAVDGDTLLVGATGEGSDTAETPNNNLAAAGAAYIFTRSAGVWSQRDYLKASNADSGDVFGVSVALDGNTLAVGANGERGDANSTATNPNDNAQGAGAAYVFTRSAGVWSQQVYLKASNAGTEDRFGVSVALDGDTVVVGADREDGDINSTAASPNDNGRNAGAAYVFTRSAGDWNQQAYLKASTGTPDQFGHLFGGRVALENDTVVVGAGAENGDANSTSANPNNFATNSGAAYVFSRTGGVWSDLAYLKASNAGSNDGFLVVALDGDTVAVGASGESGDASSTAANPNDNALNAGAVYLFR